MIHLQRTESLTVITLYHTVKSIVYSTVHWKQYNIQENKKIKLRSVPDRYNGRLIFSNINHKD